MGNNSNTKRERDTMKKVYAHNVNQNKVRISNKVVDESGFVVTCSNCDQNMLLSNREGEGVWFLSCPQADEECDCDSYRVFFTDSDDNIDTEQGGLH